MILNRSEDPRDPLQKATRYEIWKFAKANGVDFPDGPNGLPPADLMRAELRQRGLLRLSTSRPPLGAQNGPTGPGSAIIQQPAQQGVERDATADLVEQWAREQQRLRDEGKVKRPERHNPMNELRARAKQLGIKVDRRDNIESLRAKVEAHG
jgi:hypothetical protein